MLLSNIQRPFYGGSFTLNIHLTQHRRRKCTRWAPFNRLLVSDIVLFHLFFGVCVGGGGLQLTIFICNLCHLDKGDRRFSVSLL